MTAPLSRRTLLGTSLLVAGLSACDDVPLEQTRPGALTQPSPSPVAGPDPDEDLLRAALLLEATQVARLDRVGRVRVTADVERLLSTARTVHQAHVDLLRGDDPAPRVQPPTALPRRLLGRLAGTEIGIAEQHAAAALTAESGPFARVLASMAAAARQQATLLGPLGGAS